MLVMLVTANFKFRNRSTCSKEPIKRAGKVCGDSQDLKSPGTGRILRVRVNELPHDDNCPGAKVTHHNLLTQGNIIPHRFNLITAGHSSKLRAGDEVWGSNEHCLLTSNFHVEKIHGVKQRTLLIPYFSPR